MQAKSDGRPPDLKGFLSKWVNYRSGWRTRWFVLENGILSYCKCFVVSGSIRLTQRRPESRGRGNCLSRIDLPRQR